MGIIATSAVYGQSHSGFSISAGLNWMGTGPTELKYDVREQAPGNELAGIVRREYISTFNSFQIESMVSYTLHGFSIGGIFVIEKLKALDTETRYFRSNGNRVNLDQEGSWPKSRSQLGVIVGYNIQVNNKFVIMPAYSRSKYNFGKGTFISSDTFVNANFNYNDMFDNRYVDTYILQFKLSLNDRSLIYFNSKYAIFHMGLSEAYLKETASDVKTKSRLISMGFGFQFKIL